MSGKSFAFTGSVPYKMFSKYNSMCLGSSLDCLAIKSFKCGILTKREREEKEKRFYIIINFYLHISISHIININHVTCAATDTENMYNLKTIIKNYKLAPSFPPPPTLPPSLSSFSLSLTIFLLMASMSRKNLSKPHILSKESSTPARIGVTISLRPLV